MGRKRSHPNKAQFIPVAARGGLRADTQRRRRLSRSARRSPLRRGAVNRRRGHGGGEEAAAFMRALCAGAELLEAHGSRQRWQLPQAEVGLAAAFRALEAAKARLRLDSYAVSQVTLEQAWFPRHFPFPSSLIHFYIERPNECVRPRRCVGVACPQAEFVSLLQLRRQAPLCSGWDARAVHSH